MREIKFRTWVFKERKMLKGQNALAVKSFTPNYGYTNNEVSLMQYTGMKDMNGVDIYEGDIVKRMGITGVVTWECEYTALGFYLKSDEQLYDVISPYSSWSLEVTGNIYEDSDSTTVLWRDIRRDE